MHQFARRLLYIAALIVFMLLFFYRSIVTVLLVLGMLVLGLSVTRGVVAFLGYYNLIGLSTFATQLLVPLAIAATTDYAIFLIGRYQEARRQLTGDDSLKHEDSGRPSQVHP